MNRKEVSEKVIDIITSKVTYNDVNVDEETTFGDLCFDSFDFLEAGIFIEDEFDINIPIEQMKNMTRVSDLIDYVYASIASK